MWCENNKVHVKTSCVKVYKPLLRYIWKESKGWKIRRMTDQSYVLGPWAQAPAAHETCQGHVKTSVPRSHLRPITLKPLGTKLRHRVLKKKSSSGFNYATKGENFCFRGLI